MRIGFSDCSIKTFFIIRKSYAQAGDVAMQPGLADRNSDLFISQKKPVTFFSNFTEFRFTGNTRRELLKICLHDYLKNYLVYIWSSSLNPVLPV